MGCVVFQKGPVTGLAWLEKKSRKPVLITSSNTRAFAVFTFAYMHNKKVHSIIETVNGYPTRYE